MDTKQGDSPRERIEHRVAKGFVRLLAALGYGAIVFAVNRLAVRYTPGVISEIPVLVGWWSAVGYFMGAMSHGKS